MFKSHSYSFLLSINMFSNSIYVCVYHMPKIKEWLRNFFQLIASSILYRYAALDVDSYFT